MSKADVDTDADMTLAWSDLWHMIEASSAWSHLRRMIEAHFMLQAYFMLDEMLLAGELQEPSKKAVTRVIEVQVRRRATSIGHGKLARLSMPSYQLFQIMHSATGCLSMQSLQTLPSNS
jgi:hypothetical protein